MARNKTAQGGISLRRKVTAWLAAILLVTMLSTGIATMAGQWTVRSFDTLLADNAVCYTVQNALKETEERYRSLFENARDAIFVVDPEDGRILETNATAREELGYSREELLNLFLWDFSVDPSSDGGKRRLQDV